jgi:hypothetical protein
MQAGGNGVTVLLNVEVLAIRASGSEQHGTVARFSQGKMASKKMKCQVLLTVIAPLTDMCVFGQ